MTDRVPTGEQPLDSAQAWVGVWVRTRSVCTRHPEMGAGMPDGWTLATPLLARYPINRHHRAHDIADRERDALGRFAPRGGDA